MRKEYISPRMKLIHMSSHSVLAASDVSCDATQEKGGDWESESKGEIDEEIF